MELEILGRKTQRKVFAEAAIKFFRKELKLERSRWNLIVGFERGIQKNEGYSGAVIVPFNGMLIMKLDSGLDVENLARTIAHEMVHVKQYATGKLRMETQRGKHNFYWNGRKSSVKEYYDMPWELQAFSQESILANKFGKFLEKHI